MLLWVLVALGFVVIAGLAWYATSLLLQLKKQQEAQKAQQAEAKKKIAERNKNIAESVDTIVAAMLEGQCDYSEGSIRLCVLLDHMQFEDGTKARNTYPEMHAFYDKIKHMPTHKQRAELSKKERMKQDVERMKYEAQSQPIIEEKELPALKQYITQYL